MIRSGWNACKPFGFFLDKSNVNRSSATQVNKLSRLNHACIHRTKNYVHFCWHKTHIYTNNEIRAHKKNAKFIHKPLSIQSVSLFLWLKNQESLALQQFLFTYLLFRLLVHILCSIIRNRLYFLLRFLTLNCFYYYSTLLQESCVCVRVCALFHYEYKLNGILVVDFFLFADWFICCSWRYYLVFWPICRVD